MILDIYKKTFNCLKEKPFTLWGISLLSVVLSAAAILLFSIPGVFIVILWLIQTAMCIIFLNGYTGKEIKAEQLFETFKDWNTVKRVVGGTGWKVLWIFLWGLIPIVGPIFAIIRSYEYRLTPYILIKEPDVSIKDAIKVSKQRTSGYKLKMFLADILWVVAVEIVILLLGLLSRLNFVGWIFGFANIILCIAFAAFGCLVDGLVRSAFYVEIHKNVEGSEFYSKTEEQEKKTCENCGYDMFSTDMFCPHCGSRDGKKVESSEESFSKVVADVVDDVKEAARDVYEEASEVVNDIKEEVAEHVAEKSNDALKEDETAADAAVKETKKKTSSKKKSEEKASASKNATEIKDEAQD